MSEGEETLLQRLYRSGDTGFHQDEQGIVSRVVPAFARGYQENCVQCGRRFEQSERYVVMTVYHIELMGLRLPLCHPCAGITDHNGRVTLH